MVRSQRRTLSRWIGEQRNLDAARADPHERADLQQFEPNGAAACLRKWRVIQPNSAHRTARGRSGNPCLRVASNVWGLIPPVARAWAGGARKSLRMGRPSPIGFLPWPRDAGMLLSGLLIGGSRNAPKHRLPPDDPRRQLAAQRDAYRPADPAGGW